MEKTNQITEIEQVLLERHPGWPQEKARWMALQALGMINSQR